MKFVICLAGFLLLVSPVTAAVVINEFQVEPSGAGQWMEIYNTGLEAVDISGWFIDDSGGSEKFTVPANTQLSASTCLSFNSGNINWNTSSSDSARLINGNTIVDEYQFSSSPGDGRSFARNPDGTGSFVVISSPTRDKLNTTGESCLPSPSPTASPTPTQTPTPTHTPKPTNTPAPANTPKPTSTPNPTATPKPAATSTVTPTRVSTATTKPTSTSVVTPNYAASPIDQENPEVMGAATAVSPQLAPADESTTKNNTKPIVIALTFVGAGLAILALVATWYTWKKQQKL